MTKPNSYTEKQKQRQKQKQRLGGGGHGLSLDAFVRAKSRPSMNPSEIKKKREFYENAKKVQKYRKLLKHEGVTKTKDSDASTGDNYIEGDVKNLSSKTQSSFESQNTPVHSKNKKKSKGGKNTLHGLRQEFLKKKEEEHKLREEKTKEAKAREEARQKAMDKRKELKSNMFKKTRSGQPLMRHRLTHILETIQQQ